MAPFARREFAGAAPETTLTGTILSTTLTINGTDLTGYPTGSVGKFTIVLDMGLPTEEKVLCLSRTGNSITVASTGDRGYDGTSAVGHTAGATINHVYAALDADEANEHYSNAALDHHTNYHTAARHATAANHTFGDGTTSAFGTPAAPPATAVSGSAGSSAVPAREDHTHSVGTDSVTAASIATGAVGSDELAANSVIPGKLHSSITSDGVTLGFGVLIANVDDVTITRTGGDTHQLAVKTGGISATQLATDAVGSDEIAAGAVGTSELADTGVTAAKIDFTGIGKGLSTTVAENTGNQTGITSITTLTGMTVTFTAESGRMYQITCHLPELRQQSSTGLVRVWIREGATTLALLSEETVTSGDRTSSNASIVISPTAGAHTYYLAAETSAGTLEVNGSVLTAGNGPKQLFVKDIG